MPEYSLTSVEQFGKPRGPIRLYDSGDFYKAFDLKINDKGFNQFSKDEKNDMLVKRYGKKIFGLNKESRSDLVIPHIKPALKLEIQEQSNLKF